MTITRRPLALLALPLGLLALAGCAGNGSSGHVTPAATSEPQLMHPIAVQPRRESMVAAAPRGRLSTYESGRVAVFLQAYALSNAHFLIVTAPQHSLAATTIVQLAGSMGIPPESLVLTASDQLDAVTLSYETVVASVPPCVAHAVPGTDPANAALPTFGCATQQNLAAMLANPMDLLGPSAYGPADPTRAAQIRQVWRNREGPWAATDTNYENPTTGIEAQP